MKKKLKSFKVTFVSNEWFYASVGCESAEEAKRMVQNHADCYKVVKVEEVKDK